MRRTGGPAVSRPRVRRVQTPTETPVTRAVASEGAFAARHARIDTRRPSIVEPGRPDSDARSELSRQRARDPPGDHGAARDASRRPAVARGGGLPDRDARL